MVNDGYLWEERRDAVFYYCTNGLVHWGHVTYGAWCSAHVAPAKTWPGRPRDVVTCLFCQAGRTGLDP